MKHVKVMKKHDGHRILKKHCKEAKSSLHIHRHAHAFAAFLKHTIKIACQQYYVEQSIDVYGPPVTDFKEEVNLTVAQFSTCPIGKLDHLTKKPFFRSWLQSKGLGFEAC